MIYSDLLQLVEYAIDKELISEDDRIWALNLLMSQMKLTDFVNEENTEKKDLETLLEDIDKYAYEHGIITSMSTTYKDLFEAKIMGLLTPPPHEVISRFKANYLISPECATKWFNEFSKNTNYIKTYRIKKDKKWKYNSKYGEIDITINLSKPEKDPKEIAKFKNLPQTGYPKCALCKENEGYEGNEKNAPRENHRIIPLKLQNEKWYLQYSPYEYYNEHCICLSSEHRPMAINVELINKMFDFLDMFPHYFIGSNADLPIVGGSILSHDHMQGGHYVFAMENAETIKEIVFTGYEDVKASIIKWPLSVIRLKSSDREKVAELAEKILACWRKYSDPDAFIYSETDGEPHNTITPISRIKDNEYELDLALRNNIRTPECPLGYYHPHSDKHNIKKENIGLIEVMGLAVLPSRLLKEMSLLKNAILENKEIGKITEIAHHEKWVEKFINKYEFREDNIDEILHIEIGKTFEEVLEDCGVYKCTPEGLISFEKFIDFTNNN